MSIKSIHKKFSVDCELFEVTDGRSALSSIIVCKLPNSEQSWIYIRDNAAERIDIDSLRRSLETTKPEEEKDE